MIFGTAIGSSESAEATRGIYPQMLYFHQRATLIRSDQIILHLFQPHQADQMFDPDLGFA